MSTTTRDSLDRVIEFVSCEANELQRLANELVMLRESRWGSAKCEVRSANQDAEGLLSQAEREIEREAVERDRQRIEAQLTDIQRQLNDLNGGQHHHNPGKVAALIIARERLERELKEAQ